MVAGWGDRAGGTGWGWGDRVGLGGQDGGTGWGLHNHPTPLHVPDSCRDVSCSCPCISTGQSNPFILKPHHHCSIITWQIWTNDYFLHENAHNDPMMGRQSSGSYLALRSIYDTVRPYMSLSTLFHQLNHVYLIFQVVLSSNLGPTPKPRQLLTLYTEARLCR